VNNSNYLSRQLLNGTYYYIVRGKEQTLEAEPVEYRGDLTLIRN